MRSRAHVFDISVSASLADSDLIHRILEDLHCECILHDDVSVSDAKAVDSAHAGELLRACESRAGQVYEGDSRRTALNKPCGSRVPLGSDYSQRGPLEREGWTAGVIGYSANRCAVGEDDFRTGRGVFYLEP